MSSQMDFEYQKRPMKVYPILASELDEILRLSSSWFGGKRIRKIIERIELDSAHCPK